MNHCNKKPSPIIWWFVLFTFCLLSFAAGSFSEFCKHSKVAEVECKPCNCAESQKLILAAIDVTKNKIDAQSTQIANTCGPNGCMVEGVELCRGQLDETLSKCGQIEEQISGLSRAIADLKPKPQPLPKPAPPKVLPQVCR